MFLQRVLQIVILIKLFSNKLYNEKNEIINYKERLVTQDFSQRLGIKYEKIYTLFMDAIIFSFLIRLTLLKVFNTHLINVVVTYLYGFISNNVYIKIP